MRNDIAVGSSWQVAKGVYPELYPHLELLNFVPKQALMFSARMPARHANVASTTASGPVRTAATHPAIPSDARSGPWQTGKAARSWRLPDEHRRQPAGPAARRCGGHEVRVALRYGRSL